VREAPTEDPESIRKYEEIVDKLAKDGPLDARALQQLGAIRERLGISLTTHDRLLAERPALAVPAPKLTAFVDVSTIGFFEVGSRCMLRLSLQNDGELAFEAVELHAEVLGDGRIDVVRSQTVFPGQRETIALWLVPKVAGFQELRGVLHAVDLMGDRWFCRFEGILFRVGSGEGPQISVVNVDQSSARVVDNSKSRFGAAAEQGGVVGEATWQPIVLAPISAAQAAELVPVLRELVPAHTPTRDAPKPPAPVRARSRAGGQHVAFTVKAGEAEYQISSTIAQGDVAMVYGGVRRNDGAKVVVKVADNAGDNDLMQAEVRTLRLLRAEESPQQKHLPVVLDTFNTSDGRCGNVLEQLDGYDLFELRERLPEGVPARHMIWLMRRCLSVLGWAHSRGVLHGNIDPSHVIVRPKDHNVWLVDWCYSIVDPARTGESFRCLNEEYSAPEVGQKKPPLPSADLYSLGKTMIFAAGGDPARCTLPDSMDERLQRFIKFLVVDSPLGRAQDAWTLYAQLDRLREQLYGAHEFVELVV
jgi:hypothetical protein